ncbi:MAG: cysteine desulfurase family protein [Elusimicrobiota bacterium]
MKVYLDNNATTPLSEEVKREMKEAMDIYGNPSSLHQFGAEARNVVEKARGRVATALGCLDEEVVFTSGGTESDNLAVRGFLKNTGKRHIVTSSIEHHAVHNMFNDLEKEGYEVSRVSVDENGIVDVNELKSFLSERSALVSIMFANNEIGAVQPVRDIVSAVKDVSPGIAVHCDAVQALGKIDLNVKDLGLDLLSVSAHKINGPKGVGALYVRKGLKIKHLFAGGHHEKNIRPGTENVIGIAGFGRAAVDAAGGVEQVNKKLDKLKFKLVEGVKNRVSNVKINGDPQNTLCNTVNISFNNIEGESVIMMLDMSGIALSTGSACTSGSLQPSHVLKAMGVDPVAAQGSIRFSLGKYTNEKEIDYLLEKLPLVIERLRKMSPLEGRK